MITYHKIQSLYKRDEKGKMLFGQYSLPEFEYLRNNTWVFTEKVDGCVHSTTRIVRPDGSTTRIKHLKEGDLVLGHSPSSGIEVTPVIAVKHQNRAGEWVIVKTTRAGLGSGNSFGKLHCTFDHKVWVVDKGYVEAFELKPGDKILSCRSDISLTPIQEDILIGKMLGDGSLVYHDESRTASIEFGHVDEELTNWTLRGLGEISKDTCYYTRISGYGSKIYCGRTKQMASIYTMFKPWANRKKNVPIGIKLTPISLAFWYMDDGSLQSCDGQEDRLTLSTHGFDLESVNLLVNALYKMNIKAVRQETKKGIYIRINSVDAERFFLLVAPYICPSMKYKLPERYRDSPSWIPQKSNAFHQTIVEQEVIEIIKDDRPRERWDIQTSTENFFTTGGLVHNTNIRVMYKGNEAFGDDLTFGGKTDNAQIPAQLVNKLNELFTIDQFRDIFPATLVDLIETSPSVCLYGEGYGAKIQKGGGNYIPDGVNFVLFDVKVGDWWLKREDVEDIANKLAISVVPIIGEGTLDELARRCEEGFNSQWGDFIAEGIVARPKVELRDRAGHRIITKLKYKDFE